MPKINKIKLSGTSYDIQDSNASKTVTLTQAQYDALQEKDPNTFYIISDGETFDPSEKVDTSAFTAYSASVETALSGKQDTLIPGENITISGNVISAEGGGGKAVTGGTNISITTGETADTINCTLNAKNGTGSGSIIFGNTANVSNQQFSVAFGSGTQAKGIASIAEGESTQTTAWYCHSSGYKTLASGKWSNAEGYQTTASTQYSHTEGIGTKVTNNGEHSQGMYNTSSSDGTTSGNTLFSVGNGTSDSARHNAFEIRQNGDIYLSSGGTDIKLQDHLGGGGGGTVESAITSGSTNAVESKAIWSAVTYNVPINETLEFDNTYAATNYPSGCNSVTFEHSNGGHLPTGDYVFTSGGSEVAKLTCTVISWWPYEASWTSSDPKLTYASEGYSAVTASYSELAGDIDGVTVPSDFTIASIATASGENHLWINENTYRKDEVYNKSEINVLSGVVDSKLDTISGAVDTKLDVTAYTPTVVDSTLNDVSNNPVANSALYDELRISNTTGATETVITFDSDKFSENYPVECRKIKVEVTGTTFWSAIKLLSDKSESGSTDNQIAWHKYNSQDPVTVELGSGLTEAGATYTISGNTFEVSYPSINNIQYIYKNTSYSETIKAIASDTPLKDQVVANTASIASHIADTTIHVTTAQTASWDGAVTDIATVSGQVSTNTSNIATVSAATASNTTALGGLKLVKLTQAQYDALATKDSNTLYVING